MKIPLKVATVAILLIGAASLASGGDVRGKVTLKGKPIEGAVVRVLAANTKAAFITLTNDEGGYGFNRIPDGEYHLEVEKDGHLLRQATILISAEAVVTNLDVDRFEYPTALGWSTNSHLLVLDQGRSHYPRILELRDTGSDLVLEATFNIEPGFTAVSMGTAIWDAQEFVFLVVNTPSGLALVQQRSSHSGRLIRTWRLLQGGGGLAVDQVNRRVYVGSTQARLVYELNPQTGGLREIADLAQAEVLGPLTLDAENQKLYAADFKNGDIYLIELRRKAHQKIAKGLGNPIALALDGAQILYVLDDHRRLWSIKAGDRSHSCVVNGTGFKSLTDVTSINNTLWLADREIGALFHLTPEGSVIKRYDYFISRVW